MDSEEIPEKPDPMLYEIEKIGCICCIEVVRLIVTDYAEKLVWTVANSEGDAVSEIPESVMHKLKVGNTLGHPTWPVAEIRSEVKDKMAAWTKYEKKNRRELADYRRLHAKYGMMEARKR